MKACIIMPFLMMVFLYVIPMVINFMYFFVLVTRYKGLTIERLMRAAFLTFVPIANWFLSMETIFKDIPQKNDKDAWAKRGIDSSWERWYPQELSFFRTIYKINNAICGFFKKELIAK